MGQGISFPKPHPPTSGGDGDDDDDTATVIVLGLPEYQLVRSMEGGGSGDNANNEQLAELMKRMHYMKSGTNSDSAFIKAKDDSGDGDPTGAGDDNPPPNSGFPGAGGGGGGDGDNVPDEVPDTFQLEYIGGLEEQKGYLQRSIILPLVRPDVLKEWGVSPPKGILLHGPPGTGKTFMAKALVNALKKELGVHVNFFYHKGGDVFSMWFGESQRKLREVFETAIAMSPSIIFFDEIDGLCPSRDGSHYQGTEAYNTVVTCFLGCMDSLKNGEVFVIGATNRLEAVDPAVRRPGRFDKHLAFGFPDDEARRQIIRIHTSKWTEQRDLPTPQLLDRLAQRTKGFSGADLEKLCKDVVYVAIEANGGVITSAMQITEGHWFTALGAMQRTATNNFGSFLYIPTKPAPLVEKLIQPVVEQVIGNISPMLTPRALTVDAGVSWMHKSFLVHIEKKQSKSFLNNQILPGILCNPVFNKMSLFELSTTTITNKVLTGQKDTMMAVVFDVINQAVDAQQTENCAVVIVPNINELFDLAKVNNIPHTLLLRALGKVEGPKMFLLATSSAPVEDLQEVGAHGLFFNRHFQAGNPRIGYLTEFFQGVVFQRMKQARPGQAELLDNVAGKAAGYADNHDYESVLNLAHALGAVKMEQAKDDAQVEAEFKKVLDNYQATKMI